MFKIRNKEKEELKARITTLERENSKLHQEINRNRAKYENIINSKDLQYDLLKKEASKIFTYDDAIRILSERQEYLDSKFDEVKRTSMVDETKRYYYQRKELEAIMLTLIEEGKKKDEDIKLWMFRSD